MFWIGIDGGGTKSRLMACDESGREYGPYVGGSTNLNSNPREAVQEHIRALVELFLMERGAAWGSISALAVGSAGVDIPENVADFTALLREAGFTCPLKVVNDVEILLESEVRGRPGLVLISGTGTVGLGKSADGRTHRVGGWGHIVGDEGSGYWIGREAVRRALRSLDGREPPTLLTGLLEERLGLPSVDRILPVVYGPDANKKDMAALARLVDAAAGQGDRAGREILRCAADEIFLMAQALVTACGLVGEFPIVVGGGILTGSEALWRDLRPRLHTLSPFTIKAAREPAMGAVYLAQALRPATL